MHPNTWCLLGILFSRRYKQSWIRSANFENEVENDPLAYATHRILKPNRENRDFDSNQFVDLTYLCGTTFSELYENAANVELQNKNDTFCHVFPREHHLQCGDHKILRYLRKEVEAESTGRGIRVHERSAAVVNSLQMFFSLCPLAVDDFCKQFGSR